VRELEKVPSLPYLAPWYRVATGDGRVVLEHGQRTVSLEGRAAERLVPALLPLLDGRRTLDEIVQVLGAPARPAVERALGALAEHGVLEEGPPLPDDLPPPVAGTAELLASLRPGSRPVAETGKAVAACSVAVAGEGTAGVEVARLLRIGGVGIERAAVVEPGVDLTVCAPSGQERSRLKEWNTQALETRAPWLQVLPFDGRYASIGPLYLPGDTCCFECFRIRREANLEAGVELSELDGPAASDAAAPMLDAIVGGLAALLVSGWLVHGDHYAPGAFYAIELLPTLGLSVHHVYRVPRCPACSGLADVSPPLPWHKEVPVGDVR
jgi:bacteriocin biosynthesis cyclodehydratase domain-containing protein